MSFERRMREAIDGAIMKSAADDPPTHLVLGMKEIHEWRAFVAKMQKQHWPFQGGEARDWSYDGCRILRVDVPTMLLAGRDKL